MSESPPHRLKQAPGVRLWLHPQVADLEEFSNWLSDGEAQLLARAGQADLVLGTGRGAARRVVLGEAAAALHGVWRINRHGGFLAELLGDRYASPARLMAEIRLSSALRNLGVATPRVLLAMAVRHGLSWRQHLVTEEISDALTIFAAREQPEALAAADELLNQLCQIGLWAPDLHPGNMLWQGGRCWVIDLAGARLLPQALNSEQTAARRARFARYFAKHGGRVPTRFAESNAGLR
jgi:lipopolysaccharide kinase (Kdo/WaaP) family protein